MLVETKRDSKGISSIAISPDDPNLFLFLEIIFLRHRKKREFSLIPVDISTTTQPYKDPLRPLNQTLPDVDSFYDIDLALLPCNSPTHTIPVLNTVENPFIDDMISEEENMEESLESNNHNKSILKESNLYNQVKGAESIKVIEILPAVKVVSESEGQKVVFAKYSQKCSLAYMDYLEHEKFLGSTEIWSIQQFYKLVWLLTGFE